jgi:two-component sensor histidine kinase
VNDCARPGNELRDDHLLPVAEMIHRVRNDYTRTISLASAIAKNSSSDETKAALHEVITEMRSTAEIHNVLCPPWREGVADFAGVLARLCCAMTASSAVQHRGIKFVLRVESPIVIDAGRCWRASLAVAELINNSFRHAFPLRSGSIFITVGESCDRVFCDVSDDGSPGEIGGAGLGTRLVDALAAELDGQAERRFSNSGASVILSFAKRGPIEVSQPDEYPVGEMNLHRTHHLSGAVDADACDF